MCGTAPAAVPEEEQKAEVTRGLMERLSALVSHAKSGCRACWWKAGQCGPVGVGLLAWGCWCGVFVGLAGAGHAVARWLGLNMVRLGQKAEQASASLAPGWKARNLGPAALQWHAVWGFSRPFHLPPDPWGSGG